MSRVLLLVLLVVVFVASVALKGKSGNATGAIGFPYQPARALFSPAERSFLGVLDQAVGAEHRVFGKVRLADIADPKSGLGRPARQGALNRIAYKHFDFVVCRCGDLSVVCAVELNDKSHTSEKARARDDLLAHVCRVINLPLLTVPARASYSPQDVRAQFLAAVDPGVGRHHHSRTGAPR